MFRRTSEKTRCPGGQKCGLPKMPMCVCMCVDRGGERPPKVHGRPRLLHVDEEVALEDVFPFLVLLGLFIRLILQSKIARGP